MSRPALATCAASMSENLRGANGATAGWAASRRPLCFALESRGGSRQLVEALLAPDWRHAGGLDPLRAAIRQDDTGLHVIGELSVQHLSDPRLPRRHQDRKGDLHAMVEVAGHPVG